MSACLWVKSITWTHTQDCFLMVARDVSIDESLAKDHAQLSKLRAFYNMN